MNWRGLDERHSVRGAPSQADRALKLHEQGLIRAQIAERLCVKPDSVKGMIDRAKQRRAKMSLAAHVDQ
jgi:orotate phosphoribosyltransferase-like protein